MFERTRVFREVQGWFADYAIVATPTLSRTALPIAHDFFAPIRIDGAVADTVRRAWGPKTRGLLVGSPSNPSGTLLARDELRRIAQFVADRDGVLIVDEIYQGLVYGEAPSTALDLPGEGVLGNSFSKYFCMTGWRLGWTVLPPPGTRAFGKIAQHLFF